MLLQVLNGQYDMSLRKLLCRKLRPHVDEAVLISIDKLGADVRVRVGADYSVERIGWPHVSFLYLATLKIFVSGQYILQDAIAFCKFDTVFL